ncbi:MAG: HAMP domain-containing histidine kinase [Anaerolineae bacterium]|nr:HAMP domain-containing histidine kinase [Anaerolineae bacterium]
MTIRSKLILWYSVLLAAIIIVFGVSVFFVSRWTLVTSVDTTLTETVDQVLKNSSAELVREFGSPARIVVFFPQLDVFRASGVVVQVWDMSEAEPRLLRASSNLDDYTQPIDSSMINPDPALYQSSDSGVVTNLYSYVTVETGTWRVLTRPINVWGRPLVLQAATAFDAVNLATKGLLAILIGSMTLAVFGSIGISLLLAERALKPIDSVTRAAAKITAADDLKTRLDWTGPEDEIGRLVQVFNGVMERLEHLFSVQQRFVADVSHELRTPLTAIRGHVDLIKRYGMDKDSLDAIESEVERMSRLVSDLLLLAKADYGGLTLNAEPVDLDVIVGETLREARALASNRDLKITVLNFEPVRVSGDPDRLKQLLLNLTSNAIKFTPDGGQIILNLSRTETDAVLEVADNGIGIAAEDLKRIFDRFYQAEPSRVRKGEGAGLGLSIARWIVDAHGGKITVTSEVGVGTTFTVTLPHIEEHVASPEHAAVTRPGLRLLRRTNPPPQKIKP